MLHDKEPTAESAVSIQSIAQGGKDAPQAIPFLRFPRLVLPGAAVNDILGYAAMGSGIIAAIMVSANVGRRVTGYGFAVFFLSSLVWIAYAFLGDDPPLIIQNGVLAAINLLGVYRWLILKAPG